jgi:hypothetical protein
MKRTWILLAVAAIAVNASLWLATGVFGAGGDFFFGPKVVSAEVVVLDGSGLHDYTIHRGKIRSINGRTLTLKQRDGNVVQVPVAPDALIEGPAGRQIPYERLRTGINAETTQDKDQPASIVRVTLR